MKAPKCRSCGRLHWGVCGLVVGKDLHLAREAFDKVKMNPNPPFPVGTKEIDKVGICPHCGKRASDPVAELRGFDKKAYQREYMRRRRGKAKS